MATEPRSSGSGYSYKWNAETAKLAVTISQTQDTSAGVPVFRLPIKIGITTTQARKSRAPG